MSGGVAAHELVKNIAAHGAGAKHSEDLERDDSRVRETPSEVGTGVFFPWARLVYQSKMDKLAS